MPRPKPETVPGFIVVLFSKTYKEDTCRFVIQTLSPVYCRVIHRSADRRLWLVQVEKGKERQEIRRLTSVRRSGISAAGPLVLRPPRS